MEKSGSSSQKTNGDQNFSNIHSLQKFIEMAPLAMFIMDDEQFIYVNRSFELLTGYASNELLQMSVYDLSKHKLKITIRELITNVRIKKPNSISSELLLTTKEGKHIWVLLRLENKDREGATSLVGTLIDISQWKQPDVLKSDSLDRRRRQVEIATKISQDVTMIFDLEDLYERIVTLVKEQLLFYHVQIFRYDSTVDAVILVKGYGQIGKKLFASGHKLKLGSGVVGTAALTGKSVMAMDVTIDHDFKPNPLLPETRCELAVPIKFQGEILGILDVQSNQKDGLNLDDQILIEGLCGQIASAIEVNRLRKEIKFDTSQENRAIRAEKLQDAVYRIARAADRTDNLEDLFLDIHAIIAEVMNVENFYIALYDKEKNLLSFPYFIDEIDSHPDPTPPRKGLTEYVIRTGKPLLADLDTYNKLLQQGELELIGAPSPIWLGVPLTVDQQVIGIMAVQHYSDATIYGDREKGVLEFVSSQVAMTIKRKRSEDALRESEERFRSLFENAAIGLYRTTPDGKILVANPKIMQMLGYSRFDDLAKLNLMIEDIYVDMSRQIVMEMIEKEGQILDFESKWKRSDGSIIYIRESSRAIRDENGDVQYYEGVIEDITDRKRAEDAVKRRGDEFAALYQTTRDLAWQNDLSVILNIIADRVIALLSTSGCAIYLYKEGQNGIAAVVSNGWPEIIGIQLEPGEDIAGKVVQTLQPVVIKDYSSWEHRSEKFIEVATNTDVTMPVSAVAGMPLLYSGTLVGVLTVFEFDVNKSTPGREYSQSDIDLLSVFAGTAASAVHNAKLFSETQRRILELEVLYKASQELARASQNPENVYAAVHKAVSQLMRSDAFVITIVEEAKQEIQGVYLIDHGERRPNNKFPIGKGITSRIISTGTPIRIQDFAKQDDGINPYIFGKNGMTRSVLAVPMRSGEEIMGMISVQNYLPDMYSPEDEVLLEMLAAHAGAAIENARLFEMTKTRLVELEAVNRVSVSLRKAVSLEEMIPQLMSETLKALDADTGSFWLFDKANDLLKQVFSCGRNSKINNVEIRRGEGIFSSSFDSGDVYYSSELKDEPLLYLNVRNDLPEMWSGICVPIMAELEIIGALMICMPLPREANPDHVRLLGTLAEISGNAIHRMRLHAETEQYAAELEERVSNRTHELQEALKKAQAADLYKSEFIANINHELRTPLTNLILYYQLLRSQPGVKVEERLDVIGREMQRLRILIEDLLNLSRLDLGKTVFKPVPYNLNNLLLSLINDRRKLADEKGISLHVNLQEGLDSTWMDGSLMGQAISNLLTNAMNYSKYGCEIWVQSFTGQHNGELQVGFSVSDNGLGITEEDHPRLFERFYRGKAGHVSGAPGTGLGLAIVKQVVEMHHGEVIVSKGIGGVGATFTVWLPLINNSRTE
jgi:PAS domain S-box-containing protein